LRLRRAGWRVFWIPEAVCPQRRREKADDVVLGKKVAIYPNAFRLYYALRNELAINLKYRRPAALVRTLLYALKVAAYLLAREGFSEKLRAVGSGVADGFSGRLGKNPAYAPQ
jgi:hypothetical protein